MTAHRWAARLVTAVVLPAALVAGAVFASGPAGALPHGASIKLSTGTLVPGSTVVVSGSGWKPTTSVDTTLCGADAVSGTADCAGTTTNAMVATTRGLIWSEMVVRIPPQPCPCVILVTGQTTTVTATIPVKVQGAVTAPVHAKAPRAPAVELSQLKVSGHTTVASALGGSAVRTLTFEMTNTGNVVATATLVGRWGTGSNLTNVIEMPAVGPMKPGAVKKVTVPFRLGALAIGDYNVQVQVQVSGNARTVSVTVPTSQWPFGLFILGLVVLALLVYLIVGMRRRRAQRRREKAGAPPPPSTPDAPGEASEADVPATAGSTVSAPG